MSWSHSQQFTAAADAPTAEQAGRPVRQASPLAAMSAAALFATNRPLMEHAVAAVQQAVAQVPTDIDWLQFQTGVTRYAANPTPTSRPEYPILATAGRTTLRSAGGSGTPIVLVPSMVNRGYVLDLHPGASLVEHLRNNGHHVLLIDWGTPTEATVETLEHIITTGLEPLLHAAISQFGPLQLFGYCMGGLLALAAAVRLNSSSPIANSPTPIARLALAAMPWDFSTTTSAQHMQLAKPLLEPWLGAQTLVPPEVMAHYFWSLDPWSPIRRLMAYGQESDPARLAQMTALEDWLNDGLPLDGPVAREMLLDWYTANTPLKGEWLIGGTPILPANVNCPLWVCITQNDILVPLNSSLPFIGQAKGAQVVMADTGHIGLVCGRRAKERLYDPLTLWLKS